MIDNVKNFRNALLQTKCNPNDILEIDSVFDNTKNFEFKEVKNSLLSLVILIKEKNKQYSLHTALCKLYSFSNDSTIYLKSQISHANMKLHIKTNNNKIILCLI